MINASMTLQYNKRHTEPASGCPGSQKKTKHADLNAICCSRAFVTLCNFQISTSFNMDTAASSSFQMDATQPLPDGLLTADDFLLLFPSAAPRAPASELSLSPVNDEDPAAAKRVEKPITGRVLAEELAPYRLLSLVYLVNAFFVRWLAPSDLVRTGLAVFSFALVLSAVIVVNGSFGLFGQRQMIAGTVAALYP